MRIFIYFSAVFKYGYANDMNTDAQKKLVFWKTSNSVGASATSNLKMENFQITFRGLGENKPYFIPSIIIKMIFY